jgi:hypothetical protein
MILFYILPISIMKIIKGTRKVFNKIILYNLFVDLLYDFLLY